MTEEFSERRKYQRVAKKIPLIVYQNKKELCTAETVDLSPFGMKFSAPCHIEEESTLEVGLFLPDENGINQSLLIHGIVVWCSQLNAEYRIAIAFYNLTLDHFKILKNLVDSELKKSKIG